MCVAPSHTLWHKNNFAPTPTVRERERERGGERESERERARERERESEAIDESCSSAGRGHTRLGIFQTNIDFETLGVAIVNLEGKD
jgi:hypothetical protein